MSPSDHSRKVTAEATEKKTESPYRCDNCGATFESESKRKAHEHEEHQAGRKLDPDATRGGS